MISSNGAQLPQRVSLTPIQRELLRLAVNARGRRFAVSPAQRTLLARLCSGIDRNQTPERLLVAFKACLIEVANKSGIPHGTEREQLHASLVSGFIEELYRADFTTPGIGAGMTEGKLASGEAQLRIS